MDTLGATSSTDLKTVGTGRGSLSNLQWIWWLSGISILALAIRVASVLGRINRTPGGDSFYYFHAATLLVQRYGFINLLIAASPGHKQIATAGFAPLFTMVMAVPQLFGIQSYLAARLWLCIIGVAAVVVTAYAGREIGGRRIGLIAAFLAAIYPNIWMSTELALSESLVPLLVAWFIFQAYRFWREPNVKNAIWLGVSLGITILGRDELTILALIVIVPLALLIKDFSWEQRFKLALAALLTLGLVISPWVIRNNLVFKDFTVISNGLGVTMATANCDAVYSGPDTGYWSLQCAQTKLKKGTDESVVDTYLTQRSLNYIKKHLGDLPRVEEARLGRAFGFYHPLDQIQLDSYVETRPHRWALIGLAMYYALVLMSVAGTVALRRRRIPSFPLWAVGVSVAVSTLLTFGNTRYRTPFEVSLVLMSAVFLEWALRKLFKWDKDSYTQRSLVDEVQHSSHLQVQKQS